MKQRPKSNGRVRVATQRRTMVDHDGKIRRLSRYSCGCAGEGWHLRDQTDRRCTNCKGTNRDD